MQPIEKVLLLMNFNQFTKGLVSEGINITRQLSASLTLVHVIDDPYRRYGSYISANDLDAMREEVLQYARQRMDQIVSENSSNDVECDSTVLIGKFEKAVEEYVKANPIDLIIMGAHEHVGINSLVLGSNSRKLARTISTPVLLIKPAAEGKS